MSASRPSIPDRKRFDSDVRAFMRQPSTPWITFDRDSRVPQGEAPQALVTPPAMFPETAPQPVSEPSTLVVAAEIEDAPELPIEHVGRRRIWFVAGAIAMVAAAGALLSVRGDGKPAAKHAAAAPLVTDAPPPDLSPPPTEYEPPKAPAPKADDPRAKLGRLSIRGVASAQWVFFDGKRLLGKGARSFDVMCGTHTIAIGKRDGAQTVDVPCMGEYVVER